MNRLIAIGLLLLVSSLSTWWLTANHFKGKIAEMKLAQANANISAILSKVEENNQAIANWSATASEREKAYESLFNAVTSMHRTVDGVRNESARVSRLITTASAEQLRAYSTACTAIFDAMADRGARMGQAGAGIARQADKHSAETLLIGGRKNE